MTRLGSLFGGPVLLAILLARAPRGCARRWSWPRCSWDWRGRWSRRSARPPRASATPRPSAPTTSRVKAGSTRAVRSASASRSRTRSTTGRRRTCRRDFSLARGWLRQLDLERNDLFYDGRSRPTRATGAGCSRTGSAGSLRRTRGSTTRPRTRTRLVREDPPYLRLRARLAHWRVYEVVRARRLVSPLRRRPRAARRRSTPESFTLERRAPGPIRRARAPHALLGAERGRRLRGRGRRLDAACGRPARDRDACDEVLGVRSAWRAARGRERSC